MNRPLSTKGQLLGPPQLSQDACIRKTQASFKSGQPTKNQHGKPAITTGCFIGWQTTTSLLTIVGNLRPPQKLVGNHRKILEHPRKTARKVIKHHATPRGRKKEEKSQRSTSVHARAESLQLPICSEISAVRSACLAIERGKRWPGLWWACAPNQGANPYETNLHGTAQQHS